MPALAMPALDAGVEHWPAGQPEEARAEEARAQLASQRASQEMKTEICIGNQLASPISPYLLEPNLPNFTKIIKSLRL